VPSGPAPAFRAELADTEIEALTEMLHRWTTLSSDGFAEFLLSRPFEGPAFRYPHLRRAGGPRVIHLLDTDAVAEFPTRPGPDPRVLAWFRSTARPHRFKHMARTGALVINPWETSV
jgi:hypothetical protein